MTTIRYTRRKPDPQSDDQTQPSQSPGETKSGDVRATQAQGQRGVTTPSQPGRKDRQDPKEYGEGSDDQDQGDDENMPEADQARMGRL